MEPKLKVQDRYLYFCNSFPCAFKTQALMYLSEVLSEFGEATTFTVKRLPSTSASRPFTLSSWMSSSSLPLVTTYPLSNLLTPVSRNHGSCMSTSRMQLNLKKHNSHPMRHTIPPSSMGMYSVKSFQPIRNWSMKGNPLMMLSKC